MQVSLCVYQMQAFLTIIRFRVLHLAIHTPCFAIPSISFVISRTNEKTGIETIKEKH